MIAAAAAISSSIASSSSSSFRSNFTFFCPLHLRPWVTKCPDEIFSNSTVGLTVLEVFRENSHICPRQSLAHLLFPRGFLCYVLQGTGRK